MAAPTNMSGQARRLRELLEELFQCDRSDLDFGIYRVLNQRRDEIQRFLDERLITQIEEAFAAEQGQDATLRRQLEEAEADARGLGMEPDQVPKVLELRARLADGSQTAELADEVCADLDRFFRRYYQEGDFVSRRRYRAGTYAVPYDGEEVLLHWANRDQYYIKSSESLSSYGFTLPGKRVVRFRVVAADEEGGGFKPALGEERRFALAEHFADATVADELTVRFVYAPAEKGVKQADLNAAAAEAILGSEDLQEWRDELAAPANDSGTTLLVRHLLRFTTRNSYDYFIHKDLGGFLRRELDTFIKNDVLRIDEVETLDPSGYDRALARLRVIRRIGHEVIAFLAQVEELQKRVWLKRKLVLEQSWLMTLDVVPEALYEEIATNEAQRQAWVDLLAIADIGPGDNHPGYSDRLTPEFLQAHPHLVLDTRHFRSEFTDALLSSIGDLSAKVNGLLICADAFHALEHVAPLVKGSVGCIYIDPPYNTDNDDFLYKDNYRHSSWLSLIQDRLSGARDLLHDEGLVAVSIDDNELARLRLLADQVFGEENFVNNVTVKMSHLSGMKMSHRDKKLPKIKETLLIYAADRSQLRIAEIVQPASWDDALERYTGWLDKRDSDDPADWARVPLGQVERAKQLSDAERPQFRLDNAGVIFRTAVNDALREFPRDTTFRWQDSATGIRRLVYHGEEVLFAKDRLREYEGVLQPVVGLGDIWTDIGINNLHNEGGVEFPNGKKPLRLVERVIELASVRAAGRVVLDFFAGSGTTYEAFLRKRAEGVEFRQCILAEAGPHFESVLRPRAIKAMASTRSSGGDGTIASSVVLESYDDALDGVRLKRTQAQQDLLSGNQALHDQYLLRYIVEAETGGARLPPAAFLKPADACLEATVDGAVVTQRVDLGASFTALLGLSVSHMEVREAVRVVSGVDPEGQQVLIVWRDAETMTSERLEEWFAGVDAETRAELDIVYVNGDCTLERVRGLGEHWQLRLTEDEFERRMFERADVERAG